MMASQQITQLLYSILLGISALLSGLGQSQAEYDITSEEPLYTFGDRIEFSATIFPADQIADVLLFIQVADGSDIQVHPVLVDEAGNASLVVDLTEFPINAFSDVEYWYQVYSHSGEPYTSSRYHYNYLDNRYHWKTLDSAPFKIHWYAGDLDFAEQVLDVAGAGLISAQDLLQVFFPDSIDIYVYEHPQAMRDALPETDQDWIAGHADPAQGVVMVSLPAGPEQHLEMERQIPHESMHIAFQSVDQYSEDSKIIKQIAELKYPLKNLLDHAETVSDDPNAQSILKYIRELNSIFNELEAQAGGAEVKNDEPGVISLIGGSDDKMDEENFNILKNKINEVRNFIIDI